MAVKYVFLQRSVTMNCRLVPKYKVRRLAINIFSPQATIPAPERTGGHGSSSLHSSFAFCSRRSGT
jgi:hypothetical protein